MALGLKSAFDKGVQEKIVSTAQQMVRKLESIDEDLRSMQEAFNANSKVFFDKLNTLQDAVDDLKAQVAKSE